MKVKPFSFRHWVFVWLLFLEGARGGVLSFNRDIRPILSDHCFACHGPDSQQRKGGFRLDSFEGATGPAKSGRPAVVPGNPMASPLMRRIGASDPDEVMPPPGFHKPLTPAQRRVLGRWIELGAAYEPHWALIPPRLSQPPRVRLERWLRNAVDSFILARLESLGMDPSPQADRATLIRRLSLDLTGLPPSPADVDAFLVDRSDRAYERVVDRLLGSDHFGERMAVDWLDAARFADSNGYQVDRDREMYAWRDWVIRAYNSNLPFDRFTVEQLAGDLLPTATLEQRIATGFHRNHMMNEEGGVIPEEFLAEYAADRVETTATVWLGQTFNCARCHDHKFDPFTQRDYYSLMAFFHNVPERGVGDYGASIRRNSPPMLKLPHPEFDAALVRLRAQLVDAEALQGAARNRVKAEQSDWIRRLGAMPVRWRAGEVLSGSGSRIEPSAGRLVAGMRLPALEKGAQPVTLEIRLPAGPISAIKLEFRSPENTNAQAGLPLRGLTAFQVSEGSGQSGAPGLIPLTLVAEDGEDAMPRNESGKVLPTKDAKPFPLPLPTSTPSRLCYSIAPPISASNAVRLRLAWEVVSDQTTLPVEMQLWWTDASPDLLVPASIGASARTAASEDTGKLLDYRVARDADHEARRARVEDLRREVDKFDLQIPTTLVMEELPVARPTYILMRGSYQNRGEEVKPATPAILPGMAPELPRNRLGLARWLVDPANPLPARVTMNRLWQMLFGAGLVMTSEDFGTQGDAPTHPELLDWLASEFIRSGWDTKAMVRLLVTSATYQQSSRATPAITDRDPLNRWLARGPRFRLPAEFIRDQALSVSGLLVPRIGGPSVRPYHPPGLYEQVVAGSGAATYVVGQGDELYRRSLYTYWKRSVPNPAMLLFDAPFRESCVMRRPRTNTPLQALNLMNDPTYVEAARSLAQNVMHEAGTGRTARLVLLFRKVVSRAPRSSEGGLLQQAWTRWYDEFRLDPAAAKEWLATGSKPVDPNLDLIELAALTAVASTVMNLDEAVTRE